MAKWKLAEAIGSGTADPVANEAAVHPVPPLAVANKPAPGQRGPAGLAPRTSYTRVNTGAPPMPDAGAQSQKSLQPRGLESLPKLAHEEFSMTTMMQRPTLQDLVKEAMEGTVHKIDISMEAERQMANAGSVVREQTKTASVAAAHTPTDYVQKLANALDYIVKTSSEGVGVGAGPNALPVLQTTSSEENVDVGDMGEAHNTIPMTPAMQSSGVAPDAATAMATNDSANFPAQPVDPMGNEKAASLHARNRAVLGLNKTAVDSEALTDIAGFQAQHGYTPEEAVEHFKREQLGLAGGMLGVTGAAAAAALKGKGKGSNKTASILRKNFLVLGLAKQAQDLPEGVSASEEQAPSVPSDVARQESMISSNAAAIDYTRREAKSDPKSDLGKVLTEPALTSSTDSTLNQVFDHTQEAGAKISSDLMRTAAAQAILAKLAEAAKVDVKRAKEKQSQGMPGLTSPSGQSGFTSTSI